MPCSRTGRRGLSGRGGGKSFTEETVFEMSFCSYDFHRLKSPEKPRSGQRAQQGEMDSKAVWLRSHSQCL